MAKYIVNSNPTGSSAIGQYNVTGGKEFQRQLFMANQEQQWYRENTENQRAYDTPLAQMARFREAGINPYMAMSNITNGSGVAAQGASQQINSAADAAELSAKYDAAHGFGQLANDAASTASTIRLQDSQSQLNEVDAQTRGIENLSRLGVSRETQRSLLLGNDIAEATKNDVINRASAERSISEQNAIQAKADAERAEFDTKLRKQYGEEMTEQQIRYQEKLISDLDSQIELRTSQGRLNEAEIRHLAAQTALAYQGIKESNAKIGLMAKEGNFFSRAAFNQLSQGYANVAELLRTNEEFKATFDATVEYIKGRTTLQNFDIYGYWPNYITSQGTAIISSLTGGQGLSSPIFQKPRAPIGFGFAPKKKR